MICKRCGTEIAEKALICYRCGIATTEPRVAPPSGQSRARRSIVWSVLALLAIVMSLVKMSQGTPLEVPRFVSWIALALAAVVVVWMLLGRRS
jgi:amino acid permease